MICPFQCFKHSSGDSQLCSSYRLWKHCNCRETFSTSIWALKSCSSCNSSPCIQPKGLIMADDGWWVWHSMGLIVPLRKKILKSVYHIYMLIFIWLYIYTFLTSLRRKAEIGERPKASQSFKGIRKSVPDFLEVAMCSRGKGKIQSSRALGYNHTDKW